MSRLPFTISNQSLTFYVKGRPFSLTKDNPRYGEARRLLQTEGDHDAEHLIDLVDARQALLRDSFGAIQLIGQDIVFRGQPLKGLWVDKIFEFQAAGEPFTPIWNALDRLVHNPTPQAIERLPIFLERSKLGFLPDGRFIAFKGVAADYRSARANLDGTYFTHQIGDKPRMPREAVDADPNVTCSTGLHVGAPGYVRKYYSGDTYALVMVAVDPVDVVAVPTDYDGEKMRVCGYEVIDHLDQDYSDELLGKLKNTVTGYCPKPTPRPTGSALAALAQIGDIVSYSGCVEVAAGDYEVTQTMDVDDGERLYTIGGWLQNDRVTKVMRDGVEVTEDEELEDDTDEEEDEDDLWSDGIAVGDVVSYTEFGSDFHRVVTSIDEDRLFVIGPNGEATTVEEHEFNGTIKREDVTGAMVARIGDTIEIAGHQLLKDGLYDIAIITEETGDELQENGDDAFFEISGLTTTIPVTNGTIMSVTRNGTQIWPVATTEVTISDTAVELKSLDGHDLRDDLRRPEVGDLVAVGGITAWPPAGVYPVIEVFASGVIVQTEHDGKVAVNDAYYALLV